MNRKEKIGTNVISPEAAYNTYVKTCKKNKIQPLSDTECYKSLVLGMSGAMSLAVSQEIIGIVKFPLDEDEEIWCLLVPCSDHRIRMIFGPADGIDETIDNILKSSGEIEHNLDEVEFSSVDQF